MVDGGSGGIAARLTGARLLLTGATGFVGKAILARALADLPELGGIVVALRAADDDAAHDRLVHQVLSTEPFAHARQAVDDALGSGRLRAVAVELTADDLGRAGDAPPLGHVDVIIHCAASVSFEDPLDEVINLNVFGSVRLLRALRAGGAEPHVVHVSTAYAAGMRTGLVLERPSGETFDEPPLDVEAELAAARMWKTELEAESRLPVHQRRFAEEARAEIGPSGALPTGARAEQGRRRWVRAELTERGRERARALGWSDSYTMTKAMGERALLAERPERLTVLRPSIVESALRRPRPGWLEGLKVADPLILAYARGWMDRLPASDSVRFDVVPVDLVANACLAAAAYPPEDGPRTMAVTSGSRNPLTLRELVDIIGDHFRDHPLPDDDGLPVELGELRFSRSSKVLGGLELAGRLIETGRGLLDRVPVPRVDDAEERLHRERRKVERLERLARIYSPYGELDCMFDDRNAVALLERLDPADRERFGFDTAGIDWSSYYHHNHLPALRDLVRSMTPPRSARTSRNGRPPALPEGPPAVAFFDVEGVVLDTTVAHFYTWLRTHGMPALDRAVFSAGLAARVPGWKLADRRSRAGFNRSFYRAYRGLSAAELRREAADVLSAFILPRVQHEAVRRIRAHRRRGDHVVLVTGALDFLVAPLAHLADELVAARLVERDGIFSGELAEPPLTAEGRAALAARVAADRGADLADCHAYGDAVSDLGLLELVGHPHAVNPDFRLAREARRRRWTVHSWATEPGNRTRPVVAG